MVSIRKATIADLAILIKMGQETFAETFSKDNSQENMKAYLDHSFNSDRIEEELNDAESQYFIALMDELPVGYAKMRSNKSLEELDGKAIELERIYVIREVFGKKIGAALLQTCLDYSLENEFVWVWLGVWERNKKAQQFYFRWGFEKFGQQNFQLGDDPQIDWLMKKRIQE